MLYVDREHVTWWLYFLFVHGVCLVLRTACTAAHTDTGHIDRFLVGSLPMLSPQLTVRDVAKQHTAQTLLSAATTTASAVALSSDGTVLAAAHSSTTTATAVGGQSPYDSVTVWKLQAASISRVSSSRSGTSSSAASAKQQWQRVSTVQCSGRVQALLLYGKGGAHLYT
jgi:hypothetical protein